VLTHGHLFTDIKQASVETQNQTTAAHLSRTSVETTAGWALIVTLASTSVYFLFREIVAAIAKSKTARSGGLCEGIVKHFSEMSNVVDVLRYLLCLGCVAMELYGDDNAEIKRIVQATTALLLTVQTLSCLLAFDRTVLATTMIYEIAWENMAFLAAFFLIVFGFMLGFSALIRDSESGYQSFYASLMTTFNLAMSFDLMVTGDDTDWFTQLYSTVFALVVVVILLNMVIALMGDTVDRVQESETGWKLYQRARILVEQEILMAAFASLTGSPTDCNPHGFATWLHCLSVKGYDSSSEWAGHVHAVNATIKAQVDHVNKRIDSSQKQLNEQMQKIASQLAQVQKLLQRQPSQLGDNEKTSDADGAPSGTTLKEIGVAAQARQSQSELGPQVWAIWRVWRRASRPGWWWIAPWTVRLHNCRCGDISGDLARIVPVRMMPLSTGRLEEYFPCKLAQGTLGERPHDMYNGDPVVKKKKPPLPALPPRTSKARNKKALAKGRTLTEIRQAFMPEARHGMIKREWITGDEAQLDRVLHHSQAKKSLGRVAGAGSSPVPSALVVPIKWAELPSVKRWLESDGIAPCGHASGQEIFVDDGV
jgi:hypothetical protein